MFFALCKRRNVALKYERYANAQTAAAVYNVNRHNAEDPLVRAMDFVMDSEQSNKREELLKIKRFIRSSIQAVPMSAPRSKFLEVRRNVIQKLAAQGQDGETLFDHLWPSLKPKKEEST